MFLENYVNIRGKHLTEYRRSVGGGMLGGHYSTTVKRHDEKLAQIRIEKAECHNDEPEIKEYNVDIAIFEELEEVIRKEKMNLWNKKKFTNMFICDGESESYNLSFENKSIYFSSQIYPKKYAEKLKKLEKIIEKYIER